MDAIPSFRYFDDVKRYLDKMESEIDEQGKVLVKHQEMLARVLTSRSHIKATSVFNLSPTDIKDQKLLLRKSKVKVDPELTKIVVPNLQKLESQYSLAEDLYERHKQLEAVETQISLAFPDRRGPEYDATVAQIAKLKDKVADQLKICFAYLNKVAAEHVPKSFVKYTAAVRALVDEYVIFKDSQNFMYVSVFEGNILFTYYLMLQDVADDEGEVTPHLYVSVQWKVSNEPELRVDLNHEYMVPNKLFGEGDEVGSVGEAAKALSNMLEMENFSTALGVVPLALQLKVDPTSIEPKLFSYRDLISKISVDESEMTFVLRKEANSPEVITEVSAQLYKELKGLLKQRAKLSMKLGKVKGMNSVTFFIRSVAEGGEFDSYDVEFMRDKFGLNNSDLRKISNIINRSSGEPAPKLKTGPGGSNMGDLVKQNQIKNEEEVKRRLSHKSGD